MANIKCPVEINVEMLSEWLDAVCITWEAISCNDY